MIPTTSLAIAQLILFTPCLLLSVYVTIRHGFGRQSGWLYLIIFTIVRVVGAALEVAANSTHPSKTGLYIAAATLSSVGLSPLLLAMLGLEARANNTLDVAHAFSHRLIGLMHLPTLLALIFSIIGGTNFSSNIHTARTWLRVAIVIFFVMYLAQSVLALLLFSRIKYVPRPDRVLIYALCASIPFFAVRLIYAVLDDFLTHSTTFQLLNGSVVARGVMATLEEFVIVVLYLTAGCMIPKLTKAAAGHAWTGHAEAKAATAGGVMPVNGDATQVQQQQGYTQQHTMGQDGEYAQQQGLHQQDGYLPPTSGRGPRRNRKVRGPIHMLIRWIQDKE